MTDEKEENPFARELKALLNKHSCENTSNTPDFILARFLYGCLAMFDLATQQRETWDGRDARPTEPPETARKDWVASEDGTLRCTQCGTSVTDRAEPTVSQMCQSLDVRGVGESRDLPPDSPVDREICKRHAPLKFTGWYLGKRSAVKDVLTEARRKLKREGGEHRELDVVDVLDALEEAGLLR